jgi:hypothetical protein
MTQLFEKQLGAMRESRVIRSVVGA